MPLPVSWPHSQDRKNGYKHPQGDFPCFHYLSFLPGNLSFPNPSRTVFPLLRTKSLPNQIKRQAIRQAARKSSSNHLRRPPLYNSGKPAELTPLPKPTHRLPTSSFLIHSRNTRWNPASLNPGLLPTWPLESRSPDHAAKTPAPSANPVARKPFPKLWHPPKTDAKPPATERHPAFLRHPPQRKQTTSGHQPGRPLARK